LPIDGVASAKAVVSAPKKVNKSAVKPMRINDNVRLLVADDNQTNRLLIKSMLKDAGHCLEFAEDGLQVVAQYRAAPPDVVLMDVSMPNKDGLDATREIRLLEELQKLRHCPIVAVTANVSEQDRRKCFDAGMDAFLAKPLRKERLLETIETMLLTAKPVDTEVDAVALAL
jgi:CheY-like chemotaxis protein